MSAETPLNGRSLVTAAQCMQNFVSEMVRTEGAGSEAVDIAALEDNSTTKAFQQAPVAIRSSNAAGALKPARLRFRP